MRFNKIKAFFTSVFAHCAARFVMCAVLALCTLFVHFLDAKTAFLYVVGCAAAEVLLYALFVAKRAEKHTLLLFSVPIFALECGALSLLVVTVRQMPRADFAACCIITAFAVCFTGLLAFWVSRTKTKQPKQAK